jgi:membrane protease YdiL (CAAX protease family)
MMSSNSGWGAPSSENAPDPLTSETPRNLSAPPVEDPPFGGIEVLKIGLLMFLVPIVAAPFVVLLVQKFLFRQLSFAQVASKPWVLLAPQFIWFAVVTLFLLDYSKWRFHQSLWQTIRWNWPRHRWPVMVVIGFVTLFALQGLERLVPLPKNSPFDQFFDRPLDAYAFAFLAIAFAPFMEELFFRGFLYPVLARRLGVSAGVLLTALPFALIHEPEYKAWGPVLIIFLVGIVLTLVRAKMKSVGASFIVHAIYNGVPVIAAIVASHGFRHMEKLAQ